MSNDVITANPAQLARLTKAHWPALTKHKFDYFGPASQVTIPREDLLQLRAHLGAQLRPVDHNMAVALMDRLIGGYPNASFIADPPAYAAQLVEAAKRFPQGVIEAALPIVLQRCKAPPSVKELVDACNEQLGPMAAARSRVERMLKMLGDAKPAGGRNER